MTSLFPLCWSPWRPGGSCHSADKKTPQTLFHWLILAYSQWTMLRVSGDSKGTQPYVCVDALSPTLPSRPGCPQRWAECPRDTAGPCWWSIVSAAGHGRLQRSLSIRAGFLSTFSFSLRCEDASLGCHQEKRRLLWLWGGRWAWSQVFKPALIQIAVSHCAWYLVIPTT